MEIWRFFGLALVLALVQSVISNSDPFDYNFQNPQFDGFDHAPGEPLSPADFKNAENLTLVASPSGNSMKEDPIELAGLYEGDIIIDDKLKNKSSKNAIKWEKQKWIKGFVPYLISSQFDENERSIIARAIIEFHSQTCVVFQPRTIEFDYIHLIKGQGCSSQVGRVGGIQQVSLGSGCLIPGIVIHELVHSLGFYHEQSRYDRDQHVTVYFENIKEGMEYNFQKYSWEDTQNLSTPYDTGSIMHYGPYNFSKDRKRPTILPKNPNEKIGQRENFSKVDLIKINKLYSCKMDGISSGGGSIPTNPPNTPKPSQPQGGCVDSHQHCKSWSEMGECGRNPSWMHVNCRRSCNQCENVCSDMNQNCKKWADSGECSKNPGYMQNYCSMSCKKCETSSDSSIGRCQDKDKYCSNWASKGECKQNPNYMIANCPKSCHSCNTQ